MLIPFSIREIRDFNVGSGIVTNWQMPHYAIRQKIEVFAFQLNFFGTPEQIEERQYRRQEYIGTALAFFY